MNEKIRKFYELVDACASADECVRCLHGIDWSGLNSTYRGHRAHPISKVVARDRMDVYDLLVREIDVGSLPSVVQAHALTAAVQYYDDTGSFRHTVDVLSRLLSDGFDPLSKLAYGPTVLLETLNARIFPEKYKMMLDTVWPRFANKKGSSLSCRAKKNRSVYPSVDRGVMPFVRRWVMGGEPRWEVLLARTDALTLGREVAALEAYALHEHAEKSLVRAEAEQAIVFGLVGVAWAILMQQVGFSTHSTSERLRRTAKRLSAACSIETIAFCDPVTQRYVNGELIDDIDWSVEGAPAELFDGTDATIERVEDAGYARMEQWFQQQDVLIPWMKPDSDGIFTKLVLQGVKKSDVTAVCILDVTTLEQAAEAMRRRRLETKAE